MKTLNILLEITLYSGILFCAIMLLKRLFKNRMSPFMHFVVWGLLIARLLIPVTLESSVHLFVIPAEISGETTQQQTSVTNTDTTLDPYISGTGQAQSQTNAGQQTQNSTTPFTAMENAATAPKANILSTEEILLAVWLTGAGISLIYLVALYGHLRRQIKKNAQPPSRRLLELFTEVKAELNIKRNVKVIGQCEYGTPAVLFPGTVLMPVNTLVSMNDGQVKYMLRHELMHFKRRDHLTSLLLSLLNAVYWFNPIVWIAFRQIRADMEIACDSDVVRYFSSDEKSTYAGIILSMFSKKQYGNLVLGMVRGKTKNIAERRIRGVFMNHKTNKKVKITAILLTSLLFFTCFTTACQPTPENGIVQGKDGGEFQEAVKGDYSSEEDLDFGTPERITEKFQNASGKLTVHLDAPVEVPETNALPVIEVTPRAFTQQDADAIVEALFKGKPLLPIRDYDNNSMTKQEIQDTIVSLGALIAQLESCDPVSEEGQKLYERFGLIPETATSADVQAVIQSLQEEIQSYQEQFDSAPDEDVMMEPSTTLADLGGGIYGIEVSCDLENSKNAWLNMSTFNMRSKAEFRSGVPYGYLPTMLRQEEGTNVPDVSQADARSQADAVVTALYPDDSLVLSAYGLFARDDSDMSDSNAQPLDISTAPKAYIFVYMRAVGGVPATYTMQDCASLLSMEDNVTNPLAYERIEVLIDDTGIVKVEWYSPMQQGETLAQNVEVLSFDKVIESFRNMIKTKYAFVDESNENYTINSADVYITRVTLGYSRVASKDTPDEFIMVPVWDFFGYLTRDIEGQPTDANERWNGLAEVDSLLTINAVDGTVIDRGLGY